MIDHTRSRLRPAPFLLVASTLLLAGCGIDEPVRQGWWGNAQSDFARILLGLMEQIVVLAAIVFVIVEGVLFLAVLRFRERRRDYVPKQTHGNTRIEVIWTILPAVVLAFMAVPTVRAIFESYPKDHSNTITVKAIGKQWWWEFEYVTDQNEQPLGIVTANEVHFPAGQRVTVLVESKDIIHAFWIPELGGKRDAIPGHSNVLWWTADKPGIYYGQCTQLCGTSHANMRLRAVVHDAAGWQAWVSAMQAANGTPAPEGTPAQIARGYELVSTGACVGCHTIKGTPLQARVGPDLSRFGERTTLGAGMYPNTHEELVRWLMDPPGRKPGNKMPNLGLSEEDASAIATYLRSLK
jgi:cytochrome c oxidase subunit 2